jgi:hypothetical protein
MYTGNEMAASNTLKFKSNASKIFYCVVFRFWAHYLAEIVHIYIWVTCPVICLCSVCPKFQITSHQCSRFSTLSKSLECVNVWSSYPFFLVRMVWSQETIKPSDIWLLLQVPPQWMTARVFWIVCLMLSNRWGNNHSIGNKAKFRNYSLSRTNIKCTL